ncbi:MAG: alcohol dehydrogenase catalytic domain-containing protein [Halioglobus sp.]|nr:alcohol dehydrogenase catalytic domain-containing protein [Halioglobus sp.]
MSEQTMQAVVLEQCGAPQNLKFQSVAKPVLDEPDHVLVKIKACGVAYRDIIERRGGHPMMRTPIIQGHEFSGEVVQIGSAVRRWRVGDRVINRYTDSCGACEECVGGDERRCLQLTQMYGLITNGGYAEYCAVHERGLERLYEGISYEEGACIMSAVSVAYHNVVNRIAVRPGETVLLTGASGGVGNAALQCIKLRGARVLAVTSSEAKVEKLKALGADEVIVNDGSSIHRAVRATSPQGVDAAVDCVGSSTLGSVLKSMKRIGRVAVIGTINPEPLKLNLGTLVVNGLTVKGSDGNTRAAMREAMTLVADGKITVHIDRTLPLQDAAEAHRLLESRRAMGRILLVP